MTLFVCSLGGSLIVPNEIDTHFLQSFRQFILKQISSGHRFILVCGGGRTARKYQVAAHTVVSLDSEEKDWLGIHATRLNAHLLRTLFKDVANPIVLKDYEKDNPKFTQSILVGAGWKPGWSTDYCAALLAEKYGAQTILNLSNISHVYDKDPRKFSDAKRYDTISWSEFRHIVGDTWEAGMSAPFDPIASKLCQKHNFKVIIANGTDLDNLERILSGKEFIGTIIEN
jgi:uridylate kinase